MKKRYKKPVELAHSVTIKFRAKLSENEWLNNDAAESGLTRSDYIRQKLFASKPLTRKATPEREAFIKALAAISQVGNNCNQIARAINRDMAAGHRINVPAELIEATLMDVQKLSSKLISELEHGSQR